MIDVWLPRADWCIDRWPAGCPHEGAQAEVFKIRGKEYRILKPYCCPATTGLPTGRVREFANWVETLFGLHLYSRDDLRRILNDHYPWGFCPWKGYDANSHFPLFDFAAYRSSWTAYWSIRDLIPHLAPRPVCRKCGLKASRWKHLQNRQHLELGKLLFCSEQCYDKWYYQIVKQKRREEKWIRIAHSRLHAMRTYLKNLKQTRVR